MKNKQLDTIAFQIGTDMIGQPVYHIHTLLETTNKFGDKKTRVLETKTVG